MVRNMMNINDDKEVTKYLENFMDKGEIAKMSAEEKRQEAENQMTPEERKVLNLQGKLRLKFYAYDTVYNAQYYKEAEDKIERLQKYLDHGMHFKADKNTLLDTAMKTQAGIMRDYKKGVKGHIRALQEWQQRYATAWENEKATYQDPSKEMLQRQDFEVLINSMDEKGLNSYLKNLDNGKVLNTFEVNYLLNKTKGNSPAHSLVKTYKEKNNIGEEYKNTKEWKEVQSNIGVLKVYENSPLFYKAPENGEELSRDAINVNNIGYKMLADYSATNNPQADTIKPIQGGKDLFAEEDN